MAEWGSRGEGTDCWCFSTSALKRARLESWHRRATSSESECPRSWIFGSALLWGRNPFCPVGAKWWQSSWPGWVHNGLLANMLGFCEGGNFGDVQGVLCSKILCQEPEHYFPGPYSKERGCWGPRGFPAH